jgi:hypothetical protein
MFFRDEVSHRLGAVRAVSHPSPSLREGMAPVAGQQDTAPPWLSLQQDLIPEHHQLDAALEGLIEEGCVMGFRFHEFLGELEEGGFFLAFLTAQ